MTVRHVFAGLGRALVAIGVLMLLFVAYQLWGTSFHEARAQRSLRHSFEQSLATTTTTVPGKPTAGSTATTVPVEVPPPPPVGQAVAVIRIPRIGVDKAVVEGVRVPDLKKGPGHFPDTPLPGQPGNVGIAGHRTTYGAPFYRLDELEPGDSILITTLQGHFRYRVDGAREVRPTQTEVLHQGAGSHLTITTCTPRFSARRRLVISATLVGDPAPTTTTSTTAAPTEPTTAPPTTVVTASLSGEGAPAGPAVLWGVICALVALLTWLAARRWRRLPAYLLGGVVFLLALFVFFENFARLLPANI